MKYILLKSKIFGDTKINLTEAIQNKKVLLKEDFNNVKDIEKTVAAEYKKNYEKIKKDIETTVSKALDSNELQDKVGEIVINCLVQFYKQIYNKKSIWIGGIKK